MTAAEILDSTVVAVVLAVLLVVVSTLFVRERRAHRRDRVVAAAELAQVPPGRAAAAAGEDARSAPTLPRAGIVVNPTKFADLDEEALRRRQAYVAAAFRSHGWDDPLWFETTAEETGGAQAREALGQGVAIVLACGGDGTVRAVAESMTGTGVPMGLLPAGTGNLLARNLDLPHTDLARALDVTFSAPDHAVDVGWLEVDRTGSDRDPERHLFLVMAGLGFDAAMMAGVEDRLKRRIGYGAYVVSGVRALYGPQAKVRMRVEDGETASLRTRGIIVGNCGKLTKNLVLMPDARIDDGYLDAVVLSPRGGIGWGEVFFAILTRDRKGQRRVQHSRGRSVEVWCEQPQEVQLDGDPIGPARRLRMEVEPGVLLVRTPTVP
ncbi:diacylglycerol/lipid kinase family protein [Kineococcus rubinsiae]|uniref:diacylglycerol/lipid kinase family protein n=1 Tax=Kineococcus rubinsiae TaxID=2609562 RepID=UPI001AD9415D|nr:diacylglycerol kinase family protein [Kineococcus rubinsiae]